MKILCVYSAGKASKRFSVEHVARLYEQVRKHSPDAIPFLCVTDRPDAVRKLGIETAELSHGWPNYWCKIELMNQIGPCLYFDLDVTVLGNLRPLIEAGSKYEFIASHGYRLPGINSSVMAWNGKVSAIYRKFITNPKAYMSIYRKGGGNRRVGDQGFIGEYWRKRITMWQSILPGMVMSYKREWVLDGTDRSNCRVLFFHGRPRPWEIEECRIT